MDGFKGCPLVQYEDLRAALREMKVYVDVTEDDLKKIYDIAMRHASERLLSRHVVGEVMQQKVITVRKDTGLEEAARLLSEKDINGVPVVDEAGKVVGMISRADIIRALYGL